MEAQPLNWVDAEAASLDRPPQPEEHGRGLADQPWRMVDLRGIAKPSPFTGVEKDWSEWRFRFEALLGLLGTRAAADQAAVADHPLRYEAYAEPLQKQAQLLQKSSSMCVQAVLLASCAEHRRTMASKHGGSW